MAGRTCAPITDVCIKIGSSSADCRANPKCCFRATSFVNTCIDGAGQAFKGDFLHCQCKPGMDCNPPAPSPPTPRRFDVSRAT